MDPSSPPMPPLDTPCWLTKSQLRLSQGIFPEDEALFEVQTVVVANPKESLQLMGLFLTGDMLVTQCESAGFRRITYFLDRLCPMRLLPCTTKMAPAQPDDVGP
ncbi:hypothetical protein ACSSS7_001001 [Eimeria intestinalis]